jgi:hypothetical protein
VLGGGFGLWLGDNIAISSMEKRARLFISNKKGMNGRYPSKLEKDYMMASYTIWSDKCPKNLYMTDG